MTLHRLRCPGDDGSGAHLAVDVRGRCDLLSLARLATAVTRCPCGRVLQLLDASAPEPSALHAARTLLADPPPSAELTRAAARVRRRLALPPAVSAPDGAAPRSRP